MNINESGAHAAPFRGAVNPRARFQNVADINVPIILLSAFDGLLYKDTLILLNMEKCVSPPSTFSLTIPAKRAATQHSNEVLSYTHLVHLMPTPRSRRLLFSVPWLPAYHLLPPSTCPLFRPSSRTAAPFLPLNTVLPVPSMLNGSSPVFLSSR